MTTIERVIQGFLPSSAGFHFANRWPSGPALRRQARVPGPVPVELELRIGDTANGLCGGMALATIDRWLRAEPPPPDRVPPPEGSALFREIVARQIDSLELGRAILRFYRAAAANASTRARIAVREAWPTVRREIDAGRPAGLGLIHVASADPRRLVGDHQVVAYGYELDARAGTVALRIYDPNHPDDDAIRLRLALVGPRGPVDYAYIPHEAPVLGLVPLGRHPV
jgi:hypothetical protein